MPLFALPLAPSSTRSHSAATKSIHFTAVLPSRKRKHSPSSPAQSPSPSQDERSSLSNNGILNAAVTNPLSLTPAEIAQYQLAGLRLDEELPRVKDFPHRGLAVDELRPSQTTTQTTVEGIEHYYDTDEEDVHRFELKQQKISGRSHLRIQHLSVLAAMLHKSLADGDMTRANRAWAMLLRTQVGGRGIDLRSTGYDTIGAHILLHSFDGPNFNPLDEDAQENEHRLSGIDKQPPWGTKAGAEKEIEYYERLILQHPYKRQFHKNVSALDYWPMLFTKKIFLIDYDYKRALELIAIADEEEEMKSSEIDEADEQSDDIQHLDPYAIEDRHRRRKELFAQERKWIKREEARQSALEAARTLASRLDERMTTPPYSDSINMLRLRGQLAQYTGDLCIPERPIEEMNDNNELRKSRRLQNGVGSEKRLLYRQRLYEHERGRDVQQDEYERASSLFEKIKKLGGNLDGIKDISGEREDEESEDTDQG